MEVCAINISSSPRHGPCDWHLVGENQASSEAARSVDVKFLGGLRSISVPPVICGNILQGQNWADVVESEELCPEAEEYGWHDLQAEQSICSPSNGDAFSARDMIHSPESMDDSIEEPAVRPCEAQNHEEQASRIITAALNKVTYDNIYSVCEELFGSLRCSSSTLKILAGQLAQRATNDTLYTNLYARVAVQIGFRLYGARQIAFQRALLDLCQAAEQLHCMHDTVQDTLPLADQMRLQLLHTIKEDKAY